MTSEPRVGESPASRLTQGTLRLPVAATGPENSLPLADALLEGPFEIGDDLPEGLREAAGNGRPRSLHPYLMQDRYSRDRSEQELEAVVLDNGILRATFLPRYGGRLWSLLDLATGRDLVYVNSVVQPANLALRNAWIAGGVEWNIGTKGHSPHTMAPLHSAMVEGPDGVPRLRMWEFDRLRRVVFQIDAWLPPGERGLYIYVRIENPNEQSVPMYWWSNAAVEENDGVRVLAPATSAYATGYEGTVGEVDVPEWNGRDHTWPATSPRAADYFYVIEQDHPWVAGVDASGHGLAIASTRGLPGRKLFCWGDGPGGRRWQEWLSPEGGRYLELQAGLTTTQFEHATMPARTSWDWVEVYGDVAADPHLAHGDDWSGAVQHVQSRIDRLVTGEALDAALAQARDVADLAPTRTLTAGAGWGALERDVRRATGEPWIDETSRPFPITTENALQAAWRRLLAGDGDPFTGADPATAPASYVTGAIWRERLERLPASWLRDYHLAVLAHSEGDVETALAYFRSSQAHEPTAWAVRGEARAVAEQGETAAAAELLARAQRLAPENAALLVEAMSAAVLAGRPEKALELFDGAPAAARSGRARLWEGTAALRTGQVARAAAVLESDITIPDLREGERSLSDLWREVFPGTDIPHRYDFRMA